MRIIEYPQPSQWADIVERPHLDVSQLNATVESVLADIREHGDEAVKRYEEKFDHVALQSLAVSEEEMLEAESLVSDELKEALRLAHHNIATFHAEQRFEGKKIERHLAWCAGKRVHPSKRWDSTFPAAPPPCSPPFSCWPHQQRLPDAGR